MFAHHCTACQKRQLIFPSQITGLANTDDGIVVGFTCWCGEPQAMRTGKQADERRTPAPVAA